MTANTCPTADQLRLFLLGRDGSPFAATDAHLAGCPRCAAALAGLDGTDELVAALRSAGTIRTPRNGLLAQLESRLIALRSAHPTLQPTMTGADATAAWPLATPTMESSLPDQAGPPPLPFAANHHPVHSTLQQPAAGPAAPPPLPPRTTGRYQMLERLGAGGMGTVYRALDPQLNRAVAIKIPRFEGSTTGGQAAQQRFLREGRAAAAVRHANVCPIYDVGEQDGVPYVVMAFVEGQSLAEVLREKKRFDNVNEAVALARQIAEGLAAVHAQNIVHRDLKPGNILIDRATGQALLTDFGLARSERDNEHLTADGSLLGTPAYMSPEQATLGGEAVGPASDQYSLGVVLYQMLTGRLPFVGEAVKIIYQIGAKSAPPASEFRPDLDPKLDAILRTAMARKPQDRYPDVRAFSGALTAWLRAAAQAAAGIASEQTNIEPPSLPPTFGVKASLALPPTLPLNRPRFQAALRRRPAVLVAAAVALLTCVGLAAFWPRGTKRPADDNNGNPENKDAETVSWVPGRRRGTSGMTPPQKVNSPIRPNSAVANPLRIKGIQAWNIESDRKVAAFDQLAWYADGSQLLLHPRDGTPWTAWDFKKGMRVPAPFGGSFDALFPDGKMAVRLLGGLPEVWENPEKPKKLAALRGADSGIMMCLTSPDGTYVAGLSQPGNGYYDLFLWDRLALVKPLKRMGLLGTSCTGNLWASDSRNILSLSSGGATLIGITQSDKEVVGTSTKSLPNPGWNLYRGSLSPDSSRFAGLVVGVEVQCWVWDVGSESRIATITGVSPESLPPAWIPPHGDKLACVLADAKTIGVFDSKTGNLFRKISGDGSRITAMLFSPNGDTLITCSEDRSVRFWDPERGDLIGTILFLAEGQWAAISPEGHYKCSPKGEEMLVFEVLKEGAEGKIDPTPAEFKKLFPEWNNVPSQVRFIGP